jgi:hypothetical protein
VKESFDSPLYDRFKPVCEAILVPQFALPDNTDRKSERAHFALLASIASPIGCDLLAPPTLIRFGKPC